MQQLGSVLRQLRDKRNLSAKTVADGICSTKYIYMLESGKRKPSIEILKQLSNRLKYDIYGIVPYLDCENPIYSREVLEGIEHLRVSSQYVELKKEIHKHANLIKSVDEKLVDLYSAIIATHLDKDYNCAKRCIERGLSHKIGLYSTENGGNNLLATIDEELIIQRCVIYVYEGEIEKARELLFKHNKCIRDNGCNQFDLHVMINWNLAYMLLLESQKKYSEMLKLADALVKKITLIHSSYMLHKIQFYVLIGVMKLNDNTRINDELIVTKRLVLLFKDKIFLKRLNKVIEDRDIIQKKKYCSNDFDKIRKEVKSTNGTVCGDLEWLQSNVLVMKIIKLDSNIIPDFIVKLEEILKARKSKDEKYHFVMDCRYESSEGIMASIEFNEYRKEMARIFEKYPRKSRIMIFREGYQNDQILMSFFKLYLPNVHILNIIDLTSNTMEKALQLIRIIDEAAMKD